MDGTGISAAIFIATLATLAWFAWGLARVPWLSRLPDALPAGPPRVSVVVAALNEEATVEPAMRSLLALDYPGLEVVAVDDRSTDGTGAILDRLAAQDPRLRVLHVAQLPASWLGKNHALHAGAAIATGELLLFTDADVVFERRALRQAAGWFVAHQLDHLTLVPEFRGRGSLVGAMVCGAGIFLLLRHPPWRLRRSPRLYFGAGAFNMVRASAYRAWGGHAPLKLEVLDDLMLGRLVKQRGLRQDALMGKGAVAVEWYPDAPAMVKGVEKNGFANLDYSVTRMAVSTAAMLAARYWPYAGLFLTTGRAWWFNAGTIAADLALHALVLRSTGFRARSLAWWPLNCAVMAYAMWRSAFATLRRGGVAWRGTLYPLGELRRAHREALAGSLAADLALPHDRAPLR